MYFTFCWCFVKAMPKNLESSFDLSRNSFMSSTTGTISIRCLTGILRRMFCSCSSGTHHIITTSDKQQELEKLGEDKIALSVAAKLMGLDSMPNEITRSRSMNSIDFCKGNSDHEMEAEHRKVISTLSFREIMPMPAYFELENDEFFVLSFENGCQKKEKRLEERKCEKGNGEFNQIREGSFLSYESVQFSTPKIHEEVKKKKKIRKVELESSSEESSSVSALAFDQLIIIDHEVPTSDSLESNSRRQLSPEPEHNECRSIGRNDNNSIIFDDPIKTKKAEGKCVGSRTKDCSSNQSYLNMCDLICKIAEAEILESNWLCRRFLLNPDDFEDIYADFESQILDQLLHELLVHQLVALPL